jgi:hypothetical protein
MTLQHKGQVSFSRVGQMMVKPMYIIPARADNIFKITKPLTFLKSLMGMIGTSKGTKTSTMRLTLDAEN